MPVYRWIGIDQSTGRKEAPSVLPKKGGWDCGCDVHLAVHKREACMARPKMGEGSRWHYIKYDAILVNGTWEKNDMYDCGLCYDCPFDEPSHTWIAKRVGSRTHRINVVRSEDSIYVSRASDSKPLFELRRQTPENVVTLACLNCGRDTITRLCSRCQQAERE